ncbi:S9 family peptidase [Ktedonosporobacter rubrisoli]|uniref:S9 family peptidase n=1 Tax=Ktedonosporobacter rubrisoli TaxID=2509675 RepID=A0A4P6JU96_KTERU|nr:S9 family peptidase [Ktedonosporobacter rubrisoli]QBD79034.1 S9 family peptidase [Ktedonosporobacter rubrisoli]
MSTPPVALIPREILFGNPARTSPQVSPDGKKMAYLAPVNNVLNVWVGTIGSDDYQPVTQDVDRGIRFYFWAADNKHILYIQDVGGNENWRLYATNLESKETRDLTPFENMQVQFIKRDKHFPNELLIGMNKDNPQVHDAYHLDLSSGELSQVAKNPGNVAGWEADAQLKIRSCVTTHPDGSLELHVRESEESEWKKLVTWDPNDSLGSGPIAFTLDGKSIYLEDSRNANAGRLVKLNIANDEITIIAEDPQYDVGNVIIHPDTYEIQAVAFFKDRVEWSVLDEAIAADFARIRAIQKGDFSITSRDNADKTWIVSFTIDNGPVQYYSYNRQTQKAEFLFDSQPDLNNYTLAQMEPVTFTARDGLTIHGYLTRPVGENQKNLPLVLDVHGGPWARDTWGYNPGAQWFANRGYACLQINFRGSTGYGKDFLNAGNKEWGRNMHNDLVDGVKWAIEQGIANPQKVAIFGGSYGGYAALVGATFTPDLFCCAVDIVGPSNLITLIKTIPPYWSTFLATFHTRVGNPETEEEFLKSRSPLFKVDQIRIPMLIAQGANDPRVKQAESEQIVAAMKEKGIEHEYMLFPDEGHGFAKPENRLKFYAAAEKFLATHLGGRYEE